MHRIQPSRFERGYGGGKQRSASEHQALDQIPGQVYTDFTYEVAQWTTYDRHKFAPNVITRYNIAMKLAIRRIGNSLGVIVPKAALEAWGLGEGDHLELSERSIRPAESARLSREVLDELKRSIALAVVRRFTPREIRAQILANLHRWKSQGMWVSAYDEWLELARKEDDGILFAAMLGRDERAVRLRQSAPYVGLLPREEVRKLNEEAAG